jgi:hypothetical protein
VPDLKFQVTGIEPASRGLTPLLNFNFKITNSPADQLIDAVLLNAQIQIQCPQRAYSPKEKQNLVELFGPPEMWGQSLRNRLWAQTNATVCAFRGEAEAAFQVPCTFDLTIAATKYIYALEDGEVSLLFLFSGSVFSRSKGLLNVEPIPWDKECVYQMPVRVWRELMEAHYPNSAWVYLQRDVFDRLYAYKREHAWLNWEQTIDSLLNCANSQSAIRNPQSMEVPA